MLTVEDCLKTLEDICYSPPCDAQGLTFSIVNTWDRRFICDVAQHVSAGNAISTAQSQVILKFVGRYREHLIVTGIDGSSLDALVAFPQFKKPPYQSTDLPREVRWAGDNKLVFRCKYNQGIIEDIKRLKGTNHFLPYPHPVFDRPHALWTVDVNSGNWEKIMDVIKRHRFGFDDTVAQYFMEVANSVGQPSTIEVDEEIVVQVRDDDFLNAWINGIQVLEG